MGRHRMMPSFSLNDKFQKKGKDKMKKYSHLKIIDAKYKAGDDIDFGTVIGELKTEDEKGNIIYYTNDEFDSCPTFLKTDKSVLDLLFNNNPEDEETIQKLLENSINTDFEYESLLSDKENPLFLVYRYLAYLVRSEKDKTEQFIKDTSGKYIDEITIPKCDIEEDMEDE